MVVVVVVVAVVGGWWLGREGPRGRSESES